MTIVLNENEWAEEMLDSKSLGAKPYETLCRIAKYYMGVGGYSKRETEKLLYDFLSECGEDYKHPRWGKCIENVLSVATKYKAIEIDCITITKSEIRNISALDGRQTKRLAFTLLCLAKYHNAVSDNESFWVNEKDCDIMRMANINTSVKRQSFLYHTLMEKGYIQFSKKVDNTNVRVCFASDGEPAINVTDFRNLGYQYQKYLGEPYFDCACCGITEKISSPSKGRKQIYCKQCAVEVAMQQKVNYVMRKRQINQKM